MHIHQKVIIFVLLNINIIKTMNEDLRQMLKDVTVRKMQIKNALEQFRRMQESTGRVYRKEIDFLLDRLNALNEYEKELNKLK